MTLTTSNLSALMPYMPAELDHNNPPRTPDELAFELNLAGGADVEPAVDPSETPKHLIVIVHNARVVDRQLGKVIKLERALHQLAS